VVTSRRQVDNTVGGVTFDVRGFDTLGEELILLVAAVGATVLLRAQRGEPDPGAGDAAEDERGPWTADALRALGAALVGPVLLLGLYVVAHGAVTPGGGFQGGVVLAGALLLVYAAGQALAVRRVRPVALVEVGEAVGAAAFVLIAVGGLVAGGAVMANFLPLGTAGDLRGGGTVPVLNVAVGLEVAGGVTLILTELLDQALLPGRR
jgi:multicomponent Na+:H+ antiporter subunit B